MVVVAKNQRNPCEKPNGVIEILKTPKKRKNDEKLVSRGARGLVERVRVLALARTSGLSWAEGRRRWSSARSSLWLLLKQVFRHFFSSLGFFKMRSLYDEKKLHIVHRLDRQTSGIVFFAKTKGAKSKFTNLMKEKKIFKIYLARVKSDFSKCQNLVQN